MAAVGNIRNLLFDLGGVVVDINRDNCIRALKNLGMQDAEQMIGLYRQQGPFQLMEQGQISAEEFRKQMRPHFSRPVTDRQIDLAISDFIVGIPLHRLQTLRNLRERYGVFVLSNTNPIMYRGVIAAHFEQEGLKASDYFDGITLSYEARATKPDAKIFRHAIDTLHMRPEETLFFDDGQANLDAAAEFGFHTCLVEPGTEFTDHLKRLGL